jgi:hypothetical protein
VSERRAFTYGAARSAPARSRWWVVGAMAVCAVVGLIAWTVAGTTQMPGDHRTSTLPTPTRSSAVRAAVAALYALSIPALTDRRRFDATVNELAEPRAVGRVRATFGAADPAMLAAFGERPSVLRSSPLGYRIDSYDGRSASVAIWTVAIAATRRYGIDVVWRTLSVDLAWTGDAWKVVGGAGSSGPAPTGPIARLAKAESRFRILRHVP